MKHKFKRGGVITDLISGIGGLIVLVVITLIIISTILASDIIGEKVPASLNYSNTTSNLAGNFTAGIDNVSEKIPTILLIAAVVLLFGVLVLLIAKSRDMGIGGDGGGSL